MISLLLRNFIYALMAPGIVAGLVPYMILRNNDGLFVSFSLRQILGIFLFIAGLCIVTHCIHMFIRDGKGTLLPFDPTRKLVIRGLYKYSRNPMYLGVITILSGESTFSNSNQLWIYTLIVFLAFNLFILVIEQPRLRRDFGDEYREYCKKVRMWI